jgi:hypothetical protein
MVIASADRASKNDTPHEGRVQKQAGARRFDSSHRLDLEREPHSDLDSPRRFAMRIAANRGCERPIVELVERNPN